MPGLTKQQLEIKNASFHTLLTRIRTKLANMTRSRDSYRNAYRAQDAFLTSVQAVNTNLHMRIHDLEVTCHQRQATIKDYDALVHVLVQDIITLESRVAHLNRTAKDFEAGANQTQGPP
jgi:predicted  nucleic acid-binding Zn-ribbon protein